MKKKNLAFCGIAVLLAIMVAACEQFEATEYRISAEEILNKLNIETPQYINSSKTSVATARIEDGGIVITSVGDGNAVVLVGDHVGLSNSARINVDVDKSGKIKTNITKLDENNKVKPVVKYNVTITGTVGSAISPSVITLMLDGTHFTTAVNDDASSWIQNLPAGLTAVISSVQAGEYPHEVEITVSGTPESASSEVFEIVIPADKAQPGWDIYVETRQGAKFDVS